MIPFMSIEVQKKGETFCFTIHYSNKIVTMKCNSLFEGFNTAQKIADESKSEKFE